MASHFEAARGAYVLRDYRRRPAADGHRLRPGHLRPPTTWSKVLPELDSAGLNVKIVAAISPQLFRLQDAAYRDRVALAGRPLGRDGDQQPGAAADARLDRRTRWWPSTR